MIRNKERGFTIIEMVLAMTFVAFLLLAIALTTVTIGKIYQRGVTLSGVNAGGRVLLTDLQRTISQAPVVANATPGTNPFKTASSSTSGALCLGTYSYIWNNGPSLYSNAGGMVTYSGGPNNGQNVRLAKYLDPTQAECSGSIPSTLPSTAIELLPSQGAGSAGLALQGSGITTSLLLGDTTQALYQVSFTLSTNDQNVLNTGAMTPLSCNAPTNVASNINYCAVNIFTFYVRAGGGQYNAG